MFYTGRQPRCSGPPGRHPVPGRDALSCRPAGLDAGAAMTFARAAGLGMASRPPGGRREGTPGAGLGCPGIQPAAGIDVASRLPQAGSLDVAVHLVGIRFPGEMPFPAGLPASGWRRARLSAVVKERQEQAPGFGAAPELIHIFLPPS